MSESNNTGDKGDFQQSVARLERAVQDFVSSATGQISDKASQVIDETAERLEREVRDRGPDGGAATRPRRRSEHRGEEKLHTRSRVLRRDQHNQKIVGVCAGIANYFGMERWFVRCLAVTGLLFMPQIVFPAYWVAYFIMDKRGDREDARERGEPVAAKKSDRRRKHRSPAPELGTRLSPRRSLRDIQADITQAELKLRRMESHVTSGKYELQRELNKIAESP